ncbi:MAG: hypothetical protein MZU95_14490 [Desulfomicrobium escambiense]|nr:hypothetical protein [Desulfomicrobium escambiense]
MTKITGMDNDTITLEQTIFYASAGGQESDTGTMNDLKVLWRPEEGHGDLLHPGVPA